MVQELAQAVQRRELELLARVAQRELERQIRQVCLRGLVLLASPSVRRSERRSELLRGFPLGHLPARWLADLQGLAPEPAPRGLPRRPLGPMHHACPRRPWFWSNQDGL